MQSCMHVSAHIGAAETIAKIRMRTAEAMQRADVSAKVKAGIERRQQTHSAETRAKISAKTRAAAQSKREAKAASMDETSLQANSAEPSCKASPRKQPTITNGNAADAANSSSSSRSSIEHKSKSRSSSHRVTGGSAAAATSTSNSEAQQLHERRKRESNSHEHRRNIAEAIRKKWEDPEYREYMCQKMREAAARRMAKPAPEPDSEPARRRRSRSRAAGSNDSSGWGRSADDSLHASPADTASLNASAGTPATRQAAWLAQMQAMGDHLRASQSLLMNMDAKIAEIKAQSSQAFINDSFMAERMDQLLAQVEQRRHELAASVAQQCAKIPSNVGFDEDGRAFLCDPDDGVAASGSGAPAPESAIAGGPRHSSTSGKAEVQVLSGNPGSSGIAYGDRNGTLYGGVGNTTGGGLHHRPGSQPFVITRSAQP